MAKITKSFQWGSHTIALETGEIARQASGAVVCSMDDTVILATGWHTDYGFLTILAQERVPGLEILTRDVHLT